MVTLRQLCGILNVYKSINQMNEQKTYLPTLAKPLFILAGYLGLIILSIESLPLAGILWIAAGIVNLMSQPNN